ncbi:hypothetical protein [Aeromonas salmonicida]|uniref:hypothetical protein n=1 Tax=Aeromonas salmonicida TaxID=645 RepID=UPI003CF717DD
MDNSILGFIGVIAGAVIGASASIVTTILTSNNSVRLQRDTDALERMERARSFQRDTLLAVQDTLNEALRLMVQAHLEDLDAHRKGGVWGRNDLSTDIAEKKRVTNQKLAALTERIADDSLRNELKGLRSNIDITSFSTSQDAAKNSLHNTVIQAEKLMENLGLLLRSQY